MKKLLIAVIAVSISLTAVPLFAVEFLIGAKAWYANWQPYLADVGEEVPWMGWQYLEIGSGMMYGPSVGIILNDRFSLSFSYLYGNLQSQFDATFTAVEGPDTRKNSITGRAETKRQDFDSAIIYMLSNTLRLYLGFKFQPLELTVHQSGGVWQIPFTGGGYSETTMVFEQYNYAPALGIGYSQPITDYLMFTANLSILYLFGTLDISHESVYYDDGSFDTPETNPPFSIEMDVRGYGVNFEPALVFVVGQKILITLGFRFQYVRTGVETVSYSGDVAPMELKGLNDYLYGGYVSVIYRL